MKRIAITLLITLIAIPLAAQQRRQVRIGGNPDAQTELEKWPKPDVVPNMSQEQLVAAFARYADRVAAADLFSGVVVLAKDGKPLLTRAYGYADRSRTAKNNPETKFNLGSINKIFTQVAIAQLAQAGKLSLSDTVRKHLPDYPSPIADRITIEQLVTHRSGMGDVFGEKFMASSSRLHTLRDYLELFKDEPLQFEPGSSQRYSNAGYIVLGLIIEKLSGMSYPDYMRRHIFAPAGMTSTGLFEATEATPNRAVGYTKRGENGPLPERQPNTAMLPARGNSAGGGYSTAGDLLRFVAALESEKFLHKQWTNWIYEKRPSGEPVQRALGIAGGAPGINAGVEQIGGYTVIALSNYDPPSAEGVVRGARQMLEPLEPRRVVRAPRAPAETALTTAVRVPMSLDHHVPTVDVKLNGTGPYRFAIDTGAGGMARISSRLADELHLETIGEVLAGDPSGRNPVQRRLVRLDSVEIGGARFSGVDATVGDSRVEGDGALGFALFHDVLLTLDYPKAELRLDRGSIGAGDGVVAFETPHGVPNIEVAVAGTTFRADVDSGSPAELTLPLASAKTLPLAEPPAVVGHARTPTNEFDVYGARLRGDVRIGSLVLSNPRLDLVEIFPHANLGYRFLSRYSVSFDQREQRMRFATGG